MRATEYIREFIKELTIDFAKNMLSDEELAKSEAGREILEVRQKLHDTIERWKHSENYSDRYATMWKLNDQNVMWLYGERLKYRNHTYEDHRANDAINELLSAAYWPVLRTTEKKVIAVDEKARELFKTHILPHIKKTKSIIINVDVEDDVLEKATRMYKLKFKKIENNTLNVSWN